jgi:hypothetical protein
MIDYRPFRNSDPPALCEIWRNSAPLRGRFQSLTPTLLEATVLSKPFFDRCGLIVACEHARPIGFAHAGFAATESGSELDTRTGSTCMLMVAQHPQREEVAGKLIACCETYLRERGCEQLMAGGTERLAPFYQGLYGGATLPGILATDQLQMTAFVAAGYRETARRSILQRALPGFRPAVDRQQIQLKRSMQVAVVAEPRAENWWEACTIGQADRFAFEARERRRQETCGRAIFWDMEPLASCWGVHARGLAELLIGLEQDRETMSLFLLGESLRLLAASGATLAEAHAPAGDPLLTTLTRLGFQEVEQAVELAK